MIQRDIHSTGSVFSGVTRGVLNGLVSVASYFSRGRRERDGISDASAWDHWLFLHRNGYEVHIAGDGVPLEPARLQEWEPLLDDVSTLVFRPGVAIETGPGGDAFDPDFSNGEGRALVERLGPLLSSHELSWVAGPEQPADSLMEEFRVKTFVASKIIRDYDVTENLFRQALAVDPDDADMLGDFARFLQEIRGDDDQAEALYNRALRADSGHAGNLGNFAIFLQEVRGDHDRAGEMYRRAVEVAPESGIHASNFALFLHTVREEDDQAEELFQRALRLEPDDPAVLSAYALFLHATRRDDELAESLYRRALLADGDSADCMGNFALFLKNVRHDYDGAEDYFRRALQADPEHSAHLGNFALFMKNVRRDYDAAEELYHRALKADPNDSNHLGNFAIFMKNLRRNEDVAEDLFRRSLNVDPDNINRLGNFVQLLLCQGRTREGLPLLDKAMNMNSPDAVVNLELWFYLLAHDPDRFGEALGRIKGILLAGGRSRGWDLRCNCRRARADGHTEADLLDVLAAVICDEAQPEALEGFPAWVRTPAWVS